MEHEKVQKIFLLFENKIENWHETKFFELNCWEKEF